jgi:hypothetical protein
MEIKYGRIVRRDIFYTGSKTKGKTSGIGDTKAIEKKEVFELFANSVCFRRAVRF